jgi:limonene-1,2-epoxide hydrolase
MTDQEQRNIEAAKLFIELYNTDIDRLVHECYTADYTITAMGVGTIEGLDQFMEIEKAGSEAAPKRIMRPAVHDHRRLVQPRGRTVHRDPRN